MINYPGGTIVYIRQISGSTQYSIDQTNWSILSFPVDVTNTNTSLGRLELQFATDIILNSTDQYFNCNSDNIQFGSTLLKSDGTRPVININIDNYDGFIQNGTNSNPGNNNIYIYNLIVNGSGYTTQIGGGWIGKSSFGNGSINNYIVNCTSFGDLPGGAIGSGGIVGSYAGTNGGNLYIYGCSSSGTMGQLDGGIIGAYAANNGNVTCKYCWTTGTIQAFAGGIFGDYAGVSGSATAINCYTTGSIGNSAGGIFGRYAGNNGSATSQNCYSNGNVDTDGGGIFGVGAGSNSGFTIASNCYSSGVITTNNRGIYATGKVNGIENNCYVANGFWSDNVANTHLTGVPLSGTIGNIWVSTVSNTPYLLNLFGYTPYSLNNINLQDSTLVQSYSQNIKTGQNSNSAIISGKTYTILQILGGDPDSYNSITVNNITGIVSTTNQTTTGIYTIYIQNTGSYNITIFTLTIESLFPCLTEDTTVLTPSGYVNIKELEKGDYIITSDNQKQKIKNIFYTKVLGNEHSNPYIIPKNSIAQNYPVTDTKLSGNHLILFKDKWIHPSISGNFKQDNKNKIIKYFHIELNNYETDHLVINNGLIVESFSGVENEFNNHIYLQRILDSYNCKVTYHYFDEQNNVCNIEYKLTKEQFIESIRKTTTIKKTKLKTENCQIYS